MLWNINGHRFATESDANAYARTHRLVVIEWFVEEGEMVADYEPQVDD